MVPSGQTSRGSSSFSYIQLSSDKAATLALRLARTASNNSWTFRVSRRPQAVKVAL